MKKKEKILIVDDERIVRESLFHWFEDEGYEVKIAESGETAIEVLKKEKFDIALVDLKMPGISGLDVLKYIKKTDQEAIVIIATAFASVSSAIAALKEGAYDYVTKPVDPDELSHLVRKALEQKALKLENQMLRENIEVIFERENIIGDTAAMKNIFSQIGTIAATDTIVMIKGESGTGKELIAKGIHNSSRRKYFPFISVKCGALNEVMLESELFGVEAGAISGSQLTRKGKVELANGGTLYLDEVGTISPKMQAALSNLIEAKQYTRIGGTEFIKSDFRLIAANKSSLETLYKEGKFLEDLFYKLSVFTIDVPPLRDRKEDIKMLAEFYIKKFCTIINKPIKNISKEALNFLMSYNWPGNVRELENAVERAAVIGKSEEILVDDLPFNISSMPPDMLDIDENNKSLSSIERKHILKVLNENKWNISRTAQALQIDRVTLYNKINKYKLRNLQQR